MTGLDVLGLVAGIFAGVACFCFILAALKRSEGLLIAGAGCLAGFVSAALSWVALLVETVAR